MMYLLDFDRTIFDTDAFLPTLSREPGCAPFAEELRAVIEDNRDNTLVTDRGRDAVWEKVSDAIRLGALSFAPGALARFVYPDAAEFLRSLGNEALIITFGEQARQRAKVESALANIVRVTTLYTGNTIKAEYLASWPGYYGQAAIYTDDRPHELEAMTARHPAIRSFEMRRDGKEGDGRWPVIRSLNELP